MDTSKTGNNSHKGCSRLMGRLFNVVCYELISNESKIRLSVGILTLLLYSNKDQIIEIRCSFHHTH